MALADALKAETIRVTSYRCTLCALLDALTPADRGALLDALADPLIRGTQISRALKVEGHEVGAHVVTRHRRGDCSQNR